MLTQYQVYENIIKNLYKKKINITTIHPTYNDNYLPLGLNLDDFDGIAWTGSVLNIYDNTDPIKRQMELANKVLNKKIKIFGSCWGLQILTTAAGGEVRKNPKGLEAIIAKDIYLNKEGLSHPMYLNKPKKFDSFCYHYDEVITLPQGTKILSFNTKSKIQSLSFVYNSSEVWAVQYHPEFDPKWMAGLMKQRKEVLLNENIFHSLEEFNKLYMYLSDVKKFNKLKNDVKIFNNLINYKLIINQEIHALELFNWLENIRNRN